MRTALWLLPLLLLAGPAAAQAASPSVTAGADSALGAVAPTRGAQAGTSAVGPLRASAGLPLRASARLPLRASARLPLRASAGVPAPAAPARRTYARPAPVREPASVPLLVGAGILGGGLGLLGGGYAGAQTGDWQCQNQGGGECDGPVVFGALVGAIAGEALLLPVAEHFVGGRRGPFLAELGASAGLAAAGVGLVYATHWDRPAAALILVTVPLAQLAAVTALARRAAD